MGDLASRSRTGGRGGRIRDLAVHRELEALGQLVDEGASVVRYVKGLLFTEDDLVRERAAEALAVAAAKLSPKKLGDLLTGLFWTLNDESGMAGRGSPEALGRILLALPDLVERHVPKLIAYLEKEEIALNDEIMDGGLVVTLGRLGPDRITLGEAGVGRLRAMLSSPEPRLRGTAAWTVGELGLASLRDALAALDGDEAAFPLYRDGELDTPSVSRIAAQASKRLA